MPFYTNSIHISKPFARNVTMGHHDNVSGSTKLANWGYIPWFTMQTKSKGFGIRTQGKLNLF
jgi:hypothetical protein